MLVTRLMVGILLLAVIGCSSFRAKPETSPRSRVFPNGTYQHDVTLTLPNGDRHHFRGVVELREDSIEVVGLSPIGTTVFRVTEQFGQGEEKVEIFVSVLQKYEKRLRQIYRQLRRLFRLKDGAAGVEEKKLKMELDHYDEHRIPRHVRIETRQFTIEVEVTGYDI